MGIFLSLSAVCPMKEGMSAPVFIPATAIKSKPQSDNVERVRPNVAGKLSLLAKDEPSVIIKLVESGEKGIPVGKVDLNTNVQAFNIYYKSANKKLAPFKPVTFLADESVPQVIMIYYVLSHACKTILSNVISNEGL